MSSYSLLPFRNALYATDSSSWDGVALRIRRGSSLILNTTQKLSPNKPKRWTYSRQNTGLVPAFRIGRRLGSIPAASHTETATTGTAPDNFGLSVVYRLVRYP